MKLSQVSIKHQWYLYSEFHWAVELAEALAHVIFKTELNKHEKKWIVGNQFFTGNEVDWMT